MKKELYTLFILCSIIITTSCKKVYNSRIDESYSNIYDTINNASILPYDIINKRLSIDNGWILNQIMIFNDTTNTWEFPSDNISPCMADNYYIFKKDNLIDSIGIFSYHDNNLCSGQSDKSLLNTKYTLKKINKLLVIEYMNNNNLEHIRILSVSDGYLMLYRQHYATSPTGTQTVIDVMDIYMPKSVIGNIKP